MPRATTRGLRRLRNEPTPTEFDLGCLYPEHPRIRPRGPLPKQRLLNWWVRSGAARGGGIVWQGGKGCSKTLSLVTVDGMAHQRWPGLRSVIGRETYPSLCTSTWDEYKQMLERMPRAMISAVSAPTSNSMGYVEWAVGGVTLLVSLSEARTWESANVGLAGVDEGHLQKEDVIEKLTTRVRQTNGAADLADDYPRITIIVTNPAGRNWIWNWANPKSKDKLDNWLWIESNVFENPALPKDYIENLEARYKPGTLMHKRWVLGQSVQLEGAVFAETFEADPEVMMHVVPDHDVSENFQRGRGLDWGIDNPCAVVWGAVDDLGAFWIYRVHRKSGLSAQAQGEIINDLEREESIRWVPSDPEIFRKIHPVPGLPRVHRSTASYFREVGCRVTPANNNRKYGLERVTDLLTPSDCYVHPCTLTTPAPRLFILNNASTQPLIDCLENLQWRGEAKTGDSGSPDDVKKKDDHEYDALRYLVAEIATVESKAAVRAKPPPKRGSTGCTYRGY